MELLRKIHGVCLLRTQGTKAEAILRNIVETNVNCISPIIWHFNCEVKAFCFLLSERGFMGFSECIAKHGVFLLERGNPLNPPYQGDFNATVIRGL